ncbi:hypothetical protein QF019_003110 [Pseudomonas frederiksbergensis]|uniref:hypothetical protein n=1 Tax=Pseudomonas frederiksbergensis TaxID=104087 RepID=UPI003D1D9A84
MADLWKPVGGVFSREPPALLHAGHPLSAVSIVTLVAVIFSVALAIRIARKSKQPGWHLRQHMVDIGVVSTLIYLVVITVVVWDRASTLLSMPLNEFGDFVAGIFGPVAFLWLVLGYLQQGDELRLSTKALEDQAGELKRSVEHQSTIAAAALKQIEAQQQTLQLQIEDREKTLLASFNIELDFKLVSEQEKVVFNARLTNNGNDSYRVYVDFDPEMTEGNHYFLGNIKSTSYKEFSVTFLESEEGVHGLCYISYEDARGNLRREGFSCRYKPMDSQPWVEKIRSASLAPPYFVRAESDTD